VELHGESISRLAETIRMFLAIHKTGRPISIAIELRFAESRMNR
jgi:hypothetical protein